MWRKIAAFLGFALAACMIVVTIVDQYNPMMGFLRGQPMETYLAALVSYVLKPRTRVWTPGQKNSTVFRRIPSAG